MYPQYYQLILFYQQLVMSTTCASLNLKYWSAKWKRWFFIFFLKSLDKEQSTPVRNSIFELYNLLNFYKLTPIDSHLLYVIVIGLLFQLFYFTLFPNSHKLSECLLILFINVTHVD